jgi:putative DNA primase/helicase
MTIVDDIPDKKSIDKIFEEATAPGCKPMAVWMPTLLKTASGGWHPIIANALIILANDEVFKGMFGYDEFRSEHLILKPPPLSQDDCEPAQGPYPRQWRDTDVMLVQSYLQRIWSQRFSFQTTEHAMLAESSMRRFHPIRDWLDSLVWDGKKRLDAWLINTFDCDDTAYVRAVGARFLIAAVRRIKQPGCKFDHLLILEGDQGIGKSTVCRELFGELYFSDNLPDSIGSKDAAMSLCGIWGLEIAEIDQIIRAEIETIKAFLSRSTDRYRPPYGKVFIERPRQGVLIGTTNLTDYLRDTTGNRRFWPVWCKRADAKWIEENRNQLWAEAAYREARSEPIWLDDASLRQNATDTQNDRMAADVWTDKVLEWLPGRVDVRIADILTHCLGVPVERQTRREQMRVSAILKLNGWSIHVHKDGLRSIRVWVKDQKPKDIFDEE